MSRTRAYKPLWVGMNGVEIGVFSRRASGAVEFEFSADWLKRDKAFSISRSIPLIEGPQRGEHILAYFDNLLPDNYQILHSIATRFGAKGTDAHSLLGTIGRDCVGALQFVADREDLRPPGPLTFNKMNEAEIESLLASLKHAPLGLTSEKEFRISIAGAQEKTALLKIEEGWAEPTGTTPTTHIFKPALGVIGMNGVNVDMSDSVANEHYCLELMRQFRLPTTHSQIAKFGDIDVLVVERFDRHLVQDGRLLRLPQEDMCQALGKPSTLKYQSDGGPGMVDVLRCLSGSDDPEKDQMNFFKANLLFWLIGATDGHAKNFSLRLSPGGGYALTPLYDVLSVQPAKTAKQLPHKYFKLAMSVGSKGHYKIDNIHGRHFVETAVAANLPAEFAREAIRHIRDRFEAAFDEAIESMPAGFPDHIHESIKAGAIRRLPLLESAFE